MGKFKLIATTVAATAILLTGCGTSNGSQKSTSQSAVSSTKATSASSKHATSQKATATLWNTAKASQLRSYIKTWGPTMNQSYQEYTTSNDVNFYGYHFPSDFASTQLVYNEHNYSAQLSQDGTGTGTDTFHVVAVYSDVESIDNRPGGYLYLFAFKNGQPYTLVSDQTNGGGGLHVRDSANQDISNAFSKIAKNTSTTTSAKSATSTTSQTTTLDDKTAGVLVSLRANADWFKEGANNNGMWYGNAGNDFGDEVVGYSYMTANGDPTSYIYYKVSGDSVTYKVWTARDSVADGYFKSTTTTLSSLENDYYSTKDQKAEVQQYANEVKPESSFNDAE